MKRNKIALPLCILLVGITVVQGTSIDKEVDGSRKIVDLTERLAANTSNPQVKGLNPSTFRYSLSDDVDCYVVDKSVLSKLERMNVNDYLQKGGYILINDEKVTTDDIKDRVQTEAGEVNFLDLSNTCGTFMLMQDDKIQLYSYTLGFVNDSEEDTNYTYDQLEAAIQDRIASMDISDLIDWIIDIIGNIDFGGKDGDGGDINEGTGTDEKITSEEVLLGTASCINLLYGIFSGKHMCSYKIDTSVIQGQKYLDKSTQKRRGIYDIVSKFTVDAEPNYRVSLYSPKISTSDSIVDSSYLLSNVTQQYTLGGEMGLEGDEVGAKVEFNYSYSGTSTSQDITNDIPIGQNYRSWISKPFRGGEYNGSYILEPSVRMLTMDDKGTFSASLTLSNFEIYNNWWIPIRFYMVDRCRKTLNISWSADEEVSQTESIG